MKKNLLFFLFLLRYFLDPRQLSQNFFPLLGRLAAAGELHRKYLLDNVVSSGERFGMTGVRNFGPDRWLDEGDQVGIGDLTFDILHCPGHSPGSVVFFNKELRFAHVGDVLFNGSVGRSDLPGGDHATLIKSIKEKLLPLGDDVGFICGHGPGSRIGHERMTNPFLTGEM